MKMEKLQWEHNIHLIIEKENICLSQKEKENLIFVWRDQSLTMFSNINAL